MSAFIFTNDAEAAVAEQVGFVIRATTQQQPGAGVQRTWLKRENEKLTAWCCTPDSAADLNLFRLAMAAEQ